MLFKDEQVKTGYDSIYPASPEPPITPYPQPPAISYPLPPICRSPQEPVYRGSIVTASPAQQFDVESLVCVLIYL